MRMPRIALATYHGLAQLYYDEAPLVTALENRNCQVIPVVWNSPEIDWTTYDIVVIRNIWDYHTQADTFRAWLDYLDEREIPILNPSNLLRWNIEKSYLQELHQHGVRTLPTIFAKGQLLHLQQTLEKQAWNAAVLKPVVSASGENTWQITTETAMASQERFDWLNHQLGMMLQPLAPQFQQEGEYSLVFFDGIFSHAMLKKPAPNNLFVQEEQGGSLQVVDVPTELIQSAKSALETVQNLTNVMPSYARVDGIRDDDGFILMEMECIEPQLYFTKAPHAAERFADVILQAI